MEFVSKRWFIGRTTTSIRFLTTVQVTTAVRALQRFTELFRQLHRTVDRKLNKATTGHNMASAQW